MNYCVLKSLQPATVIIYSPQLHTLLLHITNHVLRDPSNPSAAHQRQFVQLTLFHD